MPDPTQAAGVLDFLGKVPADLASKLLNKTDPARVISLLHFSNWISTVGPIKQVAVISGSEDEPELQFIPGAKFSYFNFSESKLWDLKDDWGDGRLGAAAASFDLVLCEQVLEHVLNPFQAVKNARLLLVSGGHLHLSVPGVNGTHGQPHFFYTGFHPEALKGFCAQAGFRRVESGGWGSKKSVQMYSTCDWSPLGVSAFMDFARRHPRRSSDLKKGVRHWLRYSRRSFFPAKPYPHFTISWATAMR